MREDTLSDDRVILHRDTGLASHNLSKKLPVPRHLIKLILVICLHPTVLVSNFWLLSTNLWYLLTKRLLRLILIVGNLFSCWSIFCLCLWGCWIEQCELHHVDDVPNFDKFKLIDLCREIQTGTKSKQRLVLLGYLVLVRLLLLLLLSEQFVENDRV